MKRIFAIILMTLSLGSCLSNFPVLDTKREARLNTRIRYKGDMTVVPVNTDGVYMAKDNESTMRDGRLYMDCIMFFGDGTVALFSVNSNSPDRMFAEIKDNLYRYINEHRIIIGRCGVYYAEGKMIYANTVDVKESVWKMRMHKYMITGRERLLETDKSDAETMENGKEYFFFPISEQSEPLDMWHVNHQLKEQKWLWEDEADWKKWKQEQKTSR